LSLCIVMNDLPRVKPPSLCNGGVQEGCGIWMEKRIDLDQPIWSKARVLDRSVSALARRFSASEMATASPPRRADRSRCRRNQQKDEAAECGGLERKKQRAQCRQGVQVRASVPARPPRFQPLHLVPQARRFLGLPSNHRPLIILAVPAAAGIDADQTGKAPVRRAR